MVLLELINKTMIHTTISIIPLVILIGAIVIYIQGEYRKHKSKISFRESIDLVGLPIVTLYIGNNKYNFLLDTGSSKCAINASVLKDIYYQPIEGEFTDASGINGIITTVPFCFITFFYKKNRFTEQFAILELDEGFASMKKNYGVTLHGIIGSNFFEKYRYVLDYYNMYAYMK